MSGPRRTPNRHSRVPTGGGRKWAIRAGAAGVAALALMLLFSFVHRENHVAHPMRFKRILVALGLASAGAPGATAASADAVDLPVPPTTVGLNLAAPNSYWPQRMFANLALAGQWQTTLKGSPPVPPENLDANGYLKSLPDDRPVMRLLSWPAADTKAAVIRCTYDGHATIAIAGKGISGVKTGDGNVSFHWVNASPPAGSAIFLRVMAMDSASPIRNLDCREDTMPRNLRFDPQFLAMVRPFKVLRFMDWQRTNENAHITWADRHTPASFYIRDQDGVSVEDMVDLATQSGADPWFNMPWNADDGYIRGFAQYVHDHLPRDRHVYVEAGNEVWNARFPMSKQAFQEGQTEALAPDPETARLYRYAERLSQVMDIWTRIFADRPGQLVRVANCQNGPNRSNLVLAYKDTAKHVDALATAPYFGYDFRKDAPADADAAFARVDDAMDQALNTALAAKAIAYKYHKRYIAYEAGQHIVLKDQPTSQQIQRDPRIHDAYQRYLDIWRQKIGDTIMMFTSVQPIVGTGSWGLMEYAGQPLSEAPKMRAVLEAVHDKPH
jgi:hypothetical protein